MAAAVQSSCSRPRIAASTRAAAIKAATSRTKRNAGQNHEVRIPAADYEKARNKRFGIDNSLLMEAGRYRLAVALIDEITHQDSYQLVSTSVHPEELR